MTNLELLTITETVDRYRVSESTIRRMIRSGALPTHRLGGRGRGVHRIIPAEADKALGITD